jgi:methylated-DNA-[protein]-cysteine S-methyltransferase
MTGMFYSYFKSPIGLVQIGGTASEVTSLDFVERRREKTESHPLIDRAARQIAEYFAGKRQVFDLPISYQGTDFQERVWGQLLKVPYGETASYQDIARGVGNPLAVRAVGAANGKNPISLIVPCHRIIGSNGTLVGYGGGLWRKEWLLKHEGCQFRK